VKWSAGQLRWLRALGHEPMMLRPAGAAAGRDEPAPAEDARPRPAPAGALAAALARAAGGRDLAALALDLEGLRRDPASKRALWPKLRALRRVP
jgi:hypothetical protein